jgi:putative membrane-bound dehydrogenase-like protein
MAHLLNPWRIVTGFILCLAFFTTSIASAADSKRFLAGAQAIDISPQRLPMDSAGSMTPRKSDAIHDPLMARCLVLDDGTSEIVMVICDSCMIPRGLLDAAKSIAAKETGIPTERMLVAATHCHSAVTVTRVFQSEIEEDYATFLTQQIARGIQQAHANRRPARIGWALGHCPQHVFNRRWHIRPGTPLDDPFDLGTDKVRMNPNPNHKSLLKPAGPTDPGVPVLAVQGLDGVPIAVWCNYSLHYVGGIPGGAFSGDYFGEFARQFTALIQPKENEPFMAAMTNGTSGDINNINFFENRKNSPPFEQIRLVAHDVAQVAFTAYQRIDFQDWVKLGMSEEQLELGVRLPSETEIARAKELIAQAGPGPWSDRRLIYAKETLDLAGYPATVSAKLQAIRIGDLGIVSTPCETFVETGLAIKEQSPLATTFVIELANGYNGYLPTPEQHALGGYETWRAKSSYLAVDAEPKVRDTLLRMLTSLARAPVSTKMPPQPVLTDALSAIESTRGGRHWVDAPTDPPKSPSESQACIQIEPGLKIELVAAEPLVFDPVAIAFDQQGRMFAVEYADYPEGSGNPAGPFLSRVVMLEDLDGDGKMDQRHVFADQLNFAHSLMPLRGGILVGAKSELVFLKDTDGDHRADIREVLFHGFVPAHAQMQIGCPQWGIDNWIYCNYGPGKVIATGPNASSKERELPRKEFRFHPLTLAFGPASGLGQYGNTIDNFGRRFFCTNRNPIIHAPISHEDLHRNPYAVFSSDQYDVSPAGGSALVYPLVEMKSNYLSHAGSHTAACGTTAFLGNALGPRFENSVFVCEPIGHLVTRSSLQYVGPILKGLRARERADFLASTDTWFRPVSLATGPDGALYLADMYRLWVEHPKFLPPEIGQRLDWRAGEDRGRIWRIVSENAPKAPAFQPPTSTEELVKLLEHPNGWQRQLAQRLLVEQQVVEAVPLLRSLVVRASNQLASGTDSADSTEPFAVQRALWTLDGLRGLQPTDVLLGMRSEHAIVRQASVELARRFLEDVAVFDKLCALAEDADALVRFQVALSVGESSEPRVSRVLARIAAQDQMHDWTLTAILTSAEKRSTAILQEILDSEDQSLAPARSAMRLIRELSAIVGARGDMEELEHWFRLVGTVADKSVSADHSANSPVWRTNAALSGLAHGLSRHKGGLGKTSLAKLLANPPRELAPSAASISKLLEKSAEIALDLHSPLGDRVAAVELLGHQVNAQMADIIPRLFDSAQPIELQVASLQSMQRGEAHWAGKLVLDKWPKLGPEVRGEALSFLLRRTETTKLALEAMAAGAVSSAMVSIDQRVTLLQHPDATIKQLSQRVFGSGISENRKGVAKEYRSALSLVGDSSRGKLVFNKVCANCHRLNGHGHEVGPDISDTRNRSREALLYDILDPNQKLEPKFTAYQVVTDEGVVLQGLIVTETPEVIVLRLAEGKEQAIARQSMEVFRSSGQSLMPEGVEKEISHQEMADLLTYLKGS